MRTIATTLAACAIGVPTGLLLALFITTRAVRHLPGMVAATLEDRKEFYRGNAGN